MVLGEVVGSVWAEHWKGLDHIGYKNCTVFSQKLVIRPHKKLFIEHFVCMNIELLVIRIDFMLLPFLSFKERNFLTVVNYL